MLWPGRIVAGVVVVVGTLVVGLVLGFQRSLIYLPDAAPQQPVDAFLPGSREVTLRTDDGLAQAAWYLPGEGAAVLLAPGNGGRNDWSTSVRASVAQW